MAKITYEQFKSEVLNNIKDYLTEDYKDFDMKLETVQKAGEAYEALIITPKEKQKGATVTPALNLTEAYNIHLAGKRLDEVIADLADIRMNTKYPTLFDHKDLVKYNKVKDMIVPRLIRKTGNEEYLADKPHTEVADLVLTYAVRMTLSDGEAGFADAVITDKLMDTYGVTTEELHSVAMANLAAREPFFCSMEQAAAGNADPLNVDNINISDYFVPLFVLTNKNKSLGAVEAINPAIMDRIYNKLGKVYVIPSTRDEVIIAPQGAIDDVKELRDTICRINSTKLKPADVLSDNIYEYDIDNHTIAVVA